VAVDARIVWRRSAECPAGYRREGAALRGTHLLRDVRPISCFDPDVSGHKMTQEAIARAIDQHGLRQTSHPNKGETQTA
jgi:hypothetical protein